MTARATGLRKSGKRARPSSSSSSTGNSSGSSSKRADSAEEALDQASDRLDGLWAALSQQWDVLLPAAEGLLDEASATAGMSSRGKGSSGGGVLSTLSKPPSQQAKEASQDNAVMRRRAHPRLGEVTAVGHRLTAQRAGSAATAGSTSGSVELDTEAYDDTALYHALLKDLTSSAEAAGHGASVQETTGRGHKAGMRRVTRQVDRKASKGRRIRYTTIEEIVSFVAPVPRVNAPVEADTVLASLFQSDA
jgi:protein AATF/BFR2